MLHSVFKIDFNSSVPKYQQLVTGVIRAVATKELEVGDALPSVNVISQQLQLSKDTVFKAYSILKDKGVVQSVPNKGYFIAQEEQKVFLMLDTFKAYKEVLYKAFVEALPDSITVDVHFHNYNPEVFIKVIRANMHQYAKYVVMPFDNIAVLDTLRSIPKDKLLIIDWNLPVYSDQNTVYQNFDSAFANSLTGVLPFTKSYDRFVLLYPEHTHHPRQIISVFTQFCQNKSVAYGVHSEIQPGLLKEKVLFLVVSAQDLEDILVICQQKKLILGKDLGIVSYNDTPMKPFVANGISVISTNFKAMGEAAAEFVLKSAAVAKQIPTHFIHRESI